MSQEESKNDLSERMSGCPFFTRKAANMGDQNSEGRRNGEADLLVYNTYLQLDKILNAQAPVTLKHNVKAHDEHLFIIIHQGLMRIRFKRALKH